MSYNTALADRVREKLASLKAKKVTEREMFGGISFMVAGNMACGVRGDDLMVRVDPTLHHDALTRPNASEMQMGSMSMKGFIWDGSTNGPVNPAVTDVFQNSTAATAAAYVSRLAGLDPVTPKTFAALDAYAKAGPWRAARAAGLLNLLFMSPEFLAN